MDFKGSTGWLYRLLERHVICHRIINGEEDTPKDITTSLKEEQLKGVIHQ
jgi:hypothetical protein